MLKKLIDNFPWPIAAIVFVLLVADGDRLAHALVWIAAIAIIADSFSWVFIKEKK